MSLRRYAFLAVIALTALGMGLWLAGPTEPPPELSMPGVQTLEEPLGLPSFQLTASDDRAFTNEALRGTWTLAFFGYTHCPDICPTALATLKQFKSHLKNSGQSIDPRVVFVSLDPARDTLPRLREHLQYFDPSFLGVTGPLKQLRRITEPLGIFFDYENPDTGEPLPDMEHPPAGMEYAVNHAASIYFFDPKGRLVAYVLPPHTPSQLATVLAALRKHYE